MNESYLDDLRGIARKNIGQVLASLKENMESYIYFGRDLDKDRTERLGQFIVHLESVAPSEEYLTHFRELIDEFAAVVIPGLMLYSKEKRKDLVVSLPFEIRIVLIKKLKETIPIKEIEEMLDTSIDNFFGFKELEVLEKPDTPTIGEQIKKAVQDSVDSAKEELKSFEDEIMSSYEEKIKKIEEKMERDKIYSDKGKLPPEVAEKMIKRRKKAGLRGEEYIKITPLEELKKRIHKVEVTEKKKEGVSEVISKKPEEIPVKEVIRYDKVSDKIPAEKGVRVEGMGIPQKEKEIKEEEKPVEAKKVPEEEVIKKAEPAKEAKPEEAKPEKVHYDASEVIRRIKEEHKGVSGIDKKVE